ncbi:MAG: hypothetical protein ABS36_06355 [Acidobacteria bacterium SCN 69-37]|nr:MAG: hypothetical protein ABS36_06355 [Acidobacteria bacterium SCN 69-37]
MRPSIPFLVLALCVSVVTSAWAQGTRDVTYDERTVPQVHTKVRFTTMIVLPETEEILDVVCGDKDFWVISAVQNLAYVKPAKAGATTNVNLVTASGRIYSFVLTEGAANADLKVFVTSDDTTRASSGRRRFYTETDVEALRREVAAATQEAVAARDAAGESMEAARLAAERASADADTRIDTFRAAYPGTLQFPYRFKAGERPFLVSAIFHDDRFTYIRTHGTELPTLYEIRDRMPNLVNFQVQDGLFIVPKVLDDGYLAIGKKHLLFERVQ